MKRCWYILINFFFFFLSVGLFNPNNYKYIVALLHFLAVYFMMQWGAYTAKHHLIVVIQICSYSDFFFYSTLWIIDFVIGITQLCYLLHFLTSCSIDWCGGFATNLVVITQITQLFILEFHLNTRTHAYIHIHT